MSKFRQGRSALPKRREAKGKSAAISFAWNSGECAEGVRDALFFPLYFARYLQNFHGFIKIEKEHSQLSAVNKENHEIHACIPRKRSCDDRGVLNFREPHGFMGFHKSSAVTGYHFVRQIVAYRRKV